MKFKSNIVHKTSKDKLDWLYRCNRAVGILTEEQLKEKTNYRKRKEVTCKNCLRWREEVIK